MIKKQLVILGPVILLVCTGVSGRNEVRETSTNDILQYSNKYIHETVTTKTAARIIEYPPFFLFISIIDYSTKI